MELRAKRITETLNDRIKIVREEMKITQLQMADHLGVSKSYYSDIENSRRSVSKKMIEKLNLILNVSIEWMYTGNGDIFSSKTTSDVPQNVPDIIPFLSDFKQVLNDNKLNIISDSASIAIDNILYNSLQILSFYCDDLLYRIYSSKLHKQDVIDLKKYSKNLNKYVDSVRERIRVNYNDDNALSVEDKINLINQINLKNIDCLDLIREFFRHVKDISWQNE